MFNVIPQFIVLNELKEFIVPLTKEELHQLEQAIVSEGCRDSLIIWEKSPKETVLIDGHNRYKICTQRNIPFTTKKMDFADIDEVKAWMIDNQLGRRNLNPDQLSYYRGLKYLYLKKSKGGYDYVKSKGQNELSTSEVLSSRFKVSESTIKRDSKFAEGLDIIGRSNPSLKMKILSGEVKVKKQDVQILPDSPNSEKIQIQNEADLYNKANIIREEVLEEIEKSIEKIEEKKVREEILPIEEPLFIQREDRLVKIKGMILAAMNRAIREKDIDAIRELKNLIERLEHELFN